MFITVKENQHSQYDQTISEYQRSVLHCTACLHACILHLCIAASFDADDFGVDPESVSDGCASAA